MSCPRKKFTQVWAGGIASLEKGLLPILTFPTMFLASSRQQKTVPAPPPQECHDHALDQVSRPSPSLKVNLLVSSDMGWIVFEGWERDVKRKEGEPCPLNIPPPQAAKLHAFSWA